MCFPFLFHASLSILPYFHLSCSQFLYLSIVPYFHITISNWQCFFVGSYFSKRCKLVNTTKSVEDYFKASCSRLDSNVVHYTFLLWLIYVDNLLICFDHFLIFFDNLLICFDNLLIIWVCWLGFNFCLLIIW